MKYKVHQFNIKMEEDSVKLEQFLNGLDGEVVAIIPNVNPKFLSYGATVNFVLIVEKIENN